jgi:hypothetical protein
MPLYPHLEDAAKFDAESLNTRFTLLVDAINVLGGASLQERALNTIHVPSPVIGGPSTTENSVLNVDTPDQTGSPIHVTTGSGDYETFSTDGYRIRGLSNLTLDRSADAAEPTALLVFANVEVREFTDIDVIQSSIIEQEQREVLLGPRGGRYGISLNEYTWEAAVALQFVSSAGTSAILERSERQVSPRVTIGNFGNTDPAETVVFVAGYTTGRIAMGPLRDLPGGGPPVYQQFDYKTFQDVAIRTVVTKEDLTDMGLTNIQSVRLAFKSFKDRAYKVQRANITAIPLLAEVNT